ncbi:hypothetical protein [Agromyces sp. Soil535]|uniref:hypothetical protein n=1 Tax=Agromyces sp. Soil535 TaxID=1736390 RepID=UPI000A535311|nr:hypothetical protein [Agromyces sp. Soil535]
MTPPPELMRLRFEIPDVEPPVVRVVDVPSTLRVVELHELTQSLFGWAGRFDHRFADRPSSAPGRRRVWEMEHWCRNRALDHISECSWSSSIGDAFSTLEPAERLRRTASGTLYYEYGYSANDCSDDRLDARRVRYWDEWDAESAGLRDDDPGWSWGADDERCLARSLGVADDHEHGWLVAITPGEGTPLQGSRAVGAHIVGGRGRSPIEACQGAAGYAALLAVLGNAEHPLHSQVDAWTRHLVGPWAARGTQPLDSDAFDLVAEQLALEWRPTYAAYGPPSRLDRALRVTGHRTANRAELIAALLRAMGDLSDLPTADDAEHLTAALRESLAGIPSSRAQQPATVGVDIPPAHEALLRGGRLAYRRNRVLVRSRAGDVALEEPLDLLSRVASHYWSIGSSGELALYAAMATADGRAGDDLRAWVSAAARNPDLALDELAPWCSFLGRCGGLASDPLDAKMSRALARLVLRT